MKRGGQPSRKHIIIGRDGAVDGIVPFLLDCDKAQKKGRILDAVLLCTLQGSS